MISVSENLAGGPEKQPVAKIPAPAPQAPDTSNQFLVGAIPGKDMITVVSLRCQFTKEQALNLAAWLSVLADPDGKAFARVVDEIKKT